MSKLIEASPFQILGNSHRGKYEEFCYLASLYKFGMRMSEWAHVHFPVILRL